MQWCQHLAAVPAQLWCTPVQHLTVLSVQYGYRMSKVAAHMAAWNLSGDLKERGVAVGIVHPGVVESDMTRKSKSQTQLTAQQSAEHILKVLPKISLERTGSFYDYMGNPMPW